MAVKHKGETYFSFTETASLTKQRQQYIGVWAHRGKIKKKPVPVPRDMIPATEVARLLREAGQEKEAQAILDFASGAITELPKHLQDRLEAGRKKRGRRTTEEGTA